jgi:hypothetical protein
MDGHQGYFTVAAVAGERPGDTGIFFVPGDHPGLECSQPSR